MIKKIIKSFGYALEGIINTIQSELNFRIHIAMTIIAVFLGFLLAISIIEWIIMLLLIGSILSAELINTAIETLADYISTDHNKHIKKVKDAVAGAVLILAIGAVIIALIIFIPKILLQIL